MWLLMAACKTQLRVNSFSEANRDTAAAASRQIGMAGGFERGAGCSL